MRKFIEDWIKESKRKYIEIEKLEKEIKKHNIDTIGPFFYREFADVIIQLEKDGVIEPLKSAKPYLRDVRIVLKYRKITEKMNNEEELKTEILSYHPKMRMSYYLENLNEYISDRDKLQKIARFLGEYTNGTTYITVNERSYEIFSDEKFLASNRGMEILNNISLTYNDLYCFETYEPFFYFGRMPEQNESILIVENKDTFFSVKQLLQEGINTWDNICFSMVIFGEGNKIVKSIDYLSELNVTKNAQIYYFGDLDPEGIAIYHRLKKHTKYPVKLMKMFYMEMFRRKRGEKIKKKQRWNETAIDMFLQELNCTQTGQIRSYLEKGKYVPQEAVNLDVLRRIADGTSKAV